MKIVTVSQMQKAERDCAQFGISLEQLMENAGQAVAEKTRSILKDISNQKILVLVGPGNNGGDGLVAARYLHDWGAEVLVYLCGNRPQHDPNLELVKKRQTAYLSAAEDGNFSRLGNFLKGATAAIDAVFGTGHSRPISGVFSDIFKYITQFRNNHAKLRIIALDLPSGLNADTAGADPFILGADHTITLGFPKIGLFSLPGAAFCGNMTVVDIGIPPEVVDYIDIELMQEDRIGPLLPKRPLVSHKGSYGKVLALVGSLNYSGAAFLSCTASLRVGAGLTTLAIGRSLLPILASKMAEVTYLPLPEKEPGVFSPSAAAAVYQSLSEYDVLLMGCGLGQNESTAELLRTLLLQPVFKMTQVILDADGLNLLARLPRWKESFTSDAVFTPHAGEMARLSGKKVEDIQSDRIGTARAAAAEWHKTVVLKGAYTVVASPEGRVEVSPFANPGLATAGTGDVLAGSIAGLAAQGISLFDAAACGVYLHGLAADMLRDDFGDAGILASDLLPVLPRAIRQLKGI